MSRTKNSIKIKVQDSETDELRTLTLTISATPATFWLTDILTTEGACLSLSKHMESATHKALETYLNEAKSLIKSLNKSQPNL